MFMVLPAVQQVMTLARPTVSVQNAAEAAVGKSFGSGGGVPSKNKVSIVRRVFYVESRHVNCSWDFRIKLPDSIIWASAKSIGAVLIANDALFGKPQQLA